MVKRCKKLHAPGTDPKFKFNMLVHCVQPSCPSPLTQHCLTKELTGVSGCSSYGISVNIHHSMNHACWRLRSARMSSIRLFVQDPMKTWLAKWRFFHRIKEACNGCCKGAAHLLNGNILHLGARFQTWVESITKSHSLVWTVSIWPFPGCTWHCFPSPVAFLASIPFYLSHIMQMKSWFRCNFGDIKA